MEKENGKTNSDAARYAIVIREVSDVMYNAVLKYTHSIQGAYTDVSCQRIHLAEAE